MAIGRNDLAKGPRSWEKNENKNKKENDKRIRGASCLAKHSRHLKNRFWPFSPFLFHFLISSFLSPFTSTTVFLLFWLYDYCDIVYCGHDFILLQINGCNVPIFLFFTHLFFSLFSKNENKKHVVKVRRTGTSFTVLFHRRKSLFHEPVNLVGPLFTWRICGDQLFWSRAPAISVQIVIQFGVRVSSVCMLGVESVLCGVSKYAEKGAWRWNCDRIELGWLVLKNRWSRYDRWR